MTLFLAQLRAEMLKMFARKRTYIGFGAFVFVEVLVLMLWQLPGGQRWMRRMIEHNGGLFEQYFSGLTLALIMVAMTVILLGGLYLSLVGGDVVAKEVEDGTMRMTLSRPVSRVRVLSVKYCATAIYTFALIFFIGLTALAAATLVRGNGGLFIVIPEEKLLALFDFRPGLLRYLAGLPFYAVSLMSISTFAFMLSCANMKPAAATITALTIFFIDWICHLMPYFETYRPWMMTTHMSSWLNVFRSPIPWEKMAEDYAYLLAIDATLFIVGLAIFQRRDFKS